MSVEVIGNKNVKKKCDDFNIVNNHIKHFIKIRTDNIISGKIIRDIWKTLILSKCN